MGYDLNGADLDEVRRRVVLPVVHSVLAAAELDLVRVQFGPPDGHQPAYTDDVPEVWVLLVAQGERFAYRLCNAAMDRWDAELVAANLADALEDWVCETSFGWGQHRLADYTLPPAATQERGGPSRVIELYPEEGGPFPVWENGIGLSPESLELSAALAADLFDWQQRWEAVVSGGADARADAEEALARDGRLLAERLQDEFGPAFRVVYDG